MSSLFDNKSYVLSVSLNTNSPRKLSTIDQRNSLFRHLVAIHRLHKFRREFLRHIRFKAWQSSNMHVRTLSASTRIRSFRNMDLLRYNIYVWRPRGLLQAWNRWKISLQEILRFRSEKPNTLLVLVCARCGKWNMKAKFLQSFFCAKVTDDHKQQRWPFCEWLLVQDKDFVLRVIWRIRFPPEITSKNHDKQLGENLYEITKSRDSNDKKKWFLWPESKDSTDLYIHLLREKGGTSMNGIAT